jgi:zinc transporter 2
LGDGHSHGASGSHGHSHAHSHSHDHEHEHGDSCGNHDHEDSNLNIRAALIHILGIFLSIKILGDILQSIGVIIVAIVILIWPETKYFDPICTFIFAVIVLFTTIPVSKDCINLLMEGVPRKDAVASIKKDIYECGRGEILKVHNIYYWSLVTDRNCFMCHVVVKNKNAGLLGEINNLLKGYKVVHSAVQIESEEEHESLHK